MKFSDFFTQNEKIIVERKRMDHKEILRLFQRREQDLENRRKFNDDIMSIIEHKKQQESKFNPLKFTYQGKNPKHETLQKLFNFVGFNKNEGQHGDDFKNKVLYCVIFVPAFLINTNKQ